MNETIHPRSGNDTDPMANMFSEMFDQIQTDSLTILPSGQTIRTEPRECGQSDEISDRIKKLQQRENECAAREERCKRLEELEDELLDYEVHLQSERLRLDLLNDQLLDERRQLRAEIGRQVNEKIVEERRHLQKEEDRLHVRGRRLLLVLCIGTCVFADVMLASVMAGRWQRCAATLPDWFRARYWQAGALVRHFNDFLVWVANGVPEGWWRQPFVICAAVLAIVCACALLVLPIAGYAALAKPLFSGSLNNGTLGVHVTCCLLGVLASFAIADRFGSIPGNPVHWVTWWIVLAIGTHLLYVVTIGPRINGFIIKS